MTSTKTAERHLFKRFPELAEKIPWMPLADLPTPLQRMDSLGKLLGLSDFWIKRDDLDSDLYSGNKPRKFEFIFAEAKAKGAKEIITMGSAGSNHAAATALFCREHGFDPVIFVNPQPVLSYVRKNIEVNSGQGAEIICSPNEVVSVLKIIKRIWAAKNNPAVSAPYFMYFGGSSCPGNVGFIEAGLELADQVAKGEIPLPRYLFVATGSCGTHAGLQVGLKLAGLPTEVIGVRIVPKFVTNRFVVAWHANRTVKYLRKMCPSFPDIKTSPAQIRLLDDFFGGEYGRPTSEGKEAIRLLKDYEGLSLDPTYTGKAFAGMLDFIRTHNLSDETVLFWQTLNSVDLEPHCAKCRHDDLPEELKGYFTRSLYDPEL